MVHDYCARDWKNILTNGVLFLLRILFFRLKYAFTNPGIVFVQSLQGKRDIINKNNFLKIIKSIIEV